MIEISYASSEGSGSVPAQRQHIHSMHNFRAVAILLVVSSHCYDIAWRSHIGVPSPYDFLINIISGATALFLFISGFFFHRVFSRRFDFVSFLKSRAKRLLLPYLTVTICLILLAMLLGKELRLLKHLPDLWVIFPTAILLGSAGPAMWYVPFIFVIFLMSPLFLAFCRTDSRYQIAILVVGLAIGFFVNRSMFNMNKIQNVAYFSFYYMFDMYYSVRYKELYSYFSRITIITAAGLAVIILAISQQYIGLIDNPAGQWFEWTGFNFLYFQKIAQIIFLCGFLGRYADRNLPVISLIATWSFGLFFLHQIALLLLWPVAKHWDISLGVKYADLTLWSALVIGLSVMLVWLGTKLLGKHSRYLIGA